MEPFKINCFWKFPPIFDNLTMGIGKASKTPAIHAEKLKAIKNSRKRLPDSYGTIKPIIVDLTSLLSN